MEKKDLKGLIETAAVPYSHLYAKAKGNTGYRLERLLQDRASSDMKFWHICSQGNRVLTGISIQEWDSRQLGVGCGRLDWLLAAGSEMEYSKLIGSLAHKVREWCVEKNIALLTCKVNCGQLAMVHGLADWGMKVVDCELVWGLKSPRTHCCQSISGVEIENVEKVDLESVRKLGLTFEFDRFHADYRIDNARADALWSASLYNACAERADQVVVARVADKVVGVVTCYVDGEAANHISTPVCNLVHVAVDPLWRGRGIAKEILARAIHWAGSVAGFVQVGTQSRNYAANSLYQKMGFNLVDSQYSMHSHFGHYE